MDAKHALCKHKEPCVINALKGFLRGAIIGLGIRAVIALVSSLFRRVLFKNPLILLKMFSHENMRLVYFLSGMIGFYRSVLCFLRRKTNDERLSTFIAGFASGIPLIFEDIESRTLYSLYLLSRAFDAICKYLVSKKLVPSIPYFIEAGYIASMTILLYSKNFNSDSLNRGFLNMINRFSQEPNDFIQLDATGFSDRLFLKKK